MTDSLKNLLSSVDWSKLMSSSDAKNALVGSALGGLMLGGASLASERDPEESRFAPVGDALLGALLGGVAGYGIPKGLSLFSDAGSLAPDNDKLRFGLLGPKGIGVATGLTTAGILGTVPYLKARGRLGRNAGNDYARLKSEAATTLSTLRNNLRDAQAAGSGKTPAEIDALVSDVERAAMKNIAFNNDPHMSFKDAVKLIRGRMKVSKRLGDMKGYRMSKDDLKFIRNERSLAERGFGTGVSGVGDVFREIGNERPYVAGKAKDGLLNWIVPRRIRQSIGNTLNGSHYAPHLRGSKQIGVLHKMPRRLGKYGAGAGILAYLLAKKFGPSSSNNFKN